MHANEQQPVLAICKQAMKPQTALEDVKIFFAPEGVLWIEDLALPCSWYVVVSFKRSVMSSTCPFISTPGGRLCG